MQIEATQSVRGHCVAILCLLVAALVAACGGGSDEGRPAPQAVAVEQPASGAQMRRADADKDSDDAPPQRRKARTFDKKGVTALIVAPSGNAVALATGDGKLSLLDPDSSQETRVLKTAGGTAAAGLVFSGDSENLVSVGRDSVAQVWRVQTGERRFSLRGHEHPLRGLAASADGSVIATAGEETRVMVWNGATGRLQRILRGSTDFVNALAMTPDGRLLAGATADGRVLVWDVASARLLNTLLGHADEVNAVTFSADGKLLASAGPDGKVLLWDVVTGRELKGLDVRGAPVRSLVFNRDSGLLAGGSDDGSVVLWNATTFAVALQLTGAGSAINAIAFDTKNKNKLWAGDQEGHLFSWIVPASVGN
jgi:WD40 repeat protein